MTLKTKDLTVKMLENMILESRSKVIQGQIIDFIEKMFKSSCLTHTNIRIIYKVGRGKERSHLGQMSRSK